MWKAIGLLESSCRKAESNYDLEVAGSIIKKSLVGFESMATVLKLTQVGEASSLRCSGERWLRNSANWPRNFGRRGTPWCASNGGSQQSGSSDCLLKTQDSANS